jgi:hypothetical protein
METTQPNIEALIAQIVKFPASSVPESAPGPDGTTVWHLGKAYENQPVRGDDAAYYRAAVSRIWIETDGATIAETTMARGEDDEEYLRQEINRLIASSTLAGYQARVDAAERHLNTVIMERDLAIREALKTRTQQEVARITGLTQGRIGQIARSARDHNAGDVEE